MTGPAIKALAIGLLAGLCLLIYWINYGYGPGASLIVWADSKGYAGSALSLLSPEGYQRPSGRSIGYPLFLAGIWSFSKTGSAVIYAQSLLILGATAALYYHLRGLAERVSAKRGLEVFWGKWLLAFGLVLMLSHGIMHILVQAIMPEILFATLALFALIATSWFLKLEKASTWLPLQYTGVCTAAFANVLVKPHWYFVAGFLALVLSIKLFWLLPKLRRRPAASPIYMGIIFFFTVALLFAFTLPDRTLAKLHSPDIWVHYGPKTVFCNHVPLIDDALKANPSVRLHEDRDFDAYLRDFFTELRTGKIGPWKLLGFNGDSCTYNSNFSDRIKAQFATPEQEARFYIRSVLTAALAQPLPFFWKVSKQIGYGIIFSFQKSKATMGLNDTVLRQLEANYQLTDEFAAGLRTDGRVGPFAGARRRDLPFWAQSIRFTGAVMFDVLGFILFAQALCLGALAARSYRTWNLAIRQDFVVYALLPLGMLLSHHLLVALVHTFDIWRYSMNMYFVSVAFLIGGGVFLSERLHEYRSRDTG